MDAGQAVPHRVVRAGEVIVVRPPPVVPSPLVAQVLPLAILYEDADILVLNKAAGMVVHPGAGQLQGTVVNALLAHIPDLRGVGGVERPGIVHRLDKGTSGVMIVAKHDAAHLALTRQFHDRHVSKTYQALCIGQVRASGVIEAPIGRHPTHRTAMSTESRRGRPAMTRWRVREVFATAVSLVEVDLLTGRTHQIRVHMSAAGHPLVGDGVYGKRATGRHLLPAWRLLLAEARRPMLHAWRLALAHPCTGLPMAWEAPCPEDFSTMVRQMRLLARAGEAV